MRPELFGAADIVKPIGMSRLGTPVLADETGTLGAELSGGIAGACMGGAADDANSTAVSASTITCKSATSGHSRACGGNWPFMSRCRTSIGDNGPWVCPSFV
jgi:hypothetical protein